MENYNEKDSIYNFDPMTGERLTESAPETEDSSVKAESFSNSDETASDPNTASAMSDPGQNTRKKKKDNKKPASTGRKIGIAVAIALVFGLVGGSVFFGVNYVGNRLIQRNASAVSEAAVPESQQPKTPAVVKPEKKAAEPAEDSASDAETPKEVTAYPDNTETTATDDVGSVAEVAENCMPSLVTIASVGVIEMQNFFGQTQQYQVEGAGSGVIVGMNESELLIATNNHVVKDSTELSVGFIDETSVEAYVKGADSPNDLAIVGVKLENIPKETLDQIKIATLGDSTKLVLGEEVVAIGNALGIGQSVTSGVVSALGRSMQFSDGGSHSINSTDLIQTDAPINSGNSGGGLFNMKGELIGINEAKSSMTATGTTVDGVGFAISIAKAEPILENLMSLETRDRVDEENQGYLGVTCASVTPDIAAQYSMPEGVCFTSVLEGSPAEEAGAKKGDVLINFDGRNIDSYETLTDILQYYEAGEEVTMTVMRSTEGEYYEVELSITLGDREAIASLQQNG